MIGCEPFGDLARSSSGTVSLEQPGWYDLSGIAGLEAERRVELAANEIDRGLLQRICERDQSALADLYDRHVGRMLGLASKLLADRADAEDLVHDVFLEAWQQADRYRPERGSVAAWLTIKLRSRGLDRLRKLKVAREHGLASRRDSPPADTPERNVADHGMAKQALDRLSSAEKEALDLAYYYGYTMSEIAKRCEIPVGTVKSRVSRALSSLREQLQVAGSQA